jgi:antitoxin component YwqK of YwqJK toxin-antitoxin module
LVSFLVAFLLALPLSAQQVLLLKPLLKDFTNQDFPRIQKADYYSLQKDYLISKIEDGLPQWYNEDQRAQLIHKLRPEIKEMYFWLYLDGQVSNGGFEQFYSNGFAYMIPEIKKFYQRVGDEKGLEILEKAEERFKNRPKEEVWIDLTLQRLDQEFLAHEDSSESKIETYVRANAHLYVRDENGKIFPQNFSGELVSVDPIRKERKVIVVKDNLVVGPVKLFTLEGIPLEELHFENGKQLGSQKYFDEAGRLEREEILFLGEDYKDILYFYPSGQIKSSLKENSDGKMIGEYSRYHENGSLAYSYQLDNNGKHTGTYLEFYPDGSKKAEVDRRGEEPKYINYWDESGVQQLVDGTGIYIDLYTYEGDTIRYEYQFVDFKKHGVQKEFRNGILVKYSEMNHGQYDGFHREYYPDGRLKEEYLMRAGKVVSHWSQKRFENPIIRVKIETQENESWIKSLDFKTSDTYPVLLNGDEVKNIIKVSPGVFEMDQEEHELSAYFLLHVNSQGRVTGNNSSWSENSAISHAVEELFPSLKFNPGTRSGRNVDSYIEFRVKFWLEEGDVMN